LQRQIEVTKFLWTWSLLIGPFPFYGPLSPSKLEQRVQKMTRISEPDDWRVKINWMHGWCRRLLRRQRTQDGESTK
jgi:hypothetical protein